MLLELDEYLVCVSSGPTFILPLFFLCQFPSSWQLGGINWMMEERETLVDCTCSSHGLQILVFLHFNSTALQRCVCGA
jgi:hypothetical protein